MVESSDSFEKVVLIPKERIAVLLGEKGKDKRSIERKGKIKLKIDSKEGSVQIVAKDAISLWIAGQVVEAVGRGFSPLTAQKLFKEGYLYTLINILDFGKSKKDLERLKGRVIGTKGKSRRIIQRYTGVEISVYGKTVAIIGLQDMVSLARRAVEILLSGSRHGAAYKYLVEQTGGQTDANYRRRVSKRPKKNIRS